MKNFAYPYFSRDMAEFWRRWHISLTTWFRDYVYFPLGGSKKGLLITLRNTFLVFLVSGFWHGARWTFVLWGILNALYFMPLLLLKRNRVNLETTAKERALPNIKELLSMGATFLLAAFAFIFFRAESVSGALQYIGIIFSGSFLTAPKFGIGRKKLITLTISIIILIAGEWVNRREEYGFKIQSKHKLARWIAYSVITLMILELTGREQEFIYFQF
jgi:D-alanyl-lipoteichoic acid acyltransferase DltB (MBOAT superfamily)